MSVFVTLSVMKKWFFGVGLCCAVLVLQGCYMPPEEERMGSAQNPQAERVGESAPQRDSDPQQEPESAAWGDGARNGAADRSAGGRDGRAPAPGQEAETPANVANRLAYEARQAMEQGDYDTAGRRLEQALDQDPERGVLWQHLATVRFRQREFDRSERLALRAVDLAGDDLDLLRESWWLVAAARNERGDSAGARDAAAAARRFGETGEHEYGRLR